MRKMKVIFAQGNPSKDYARTRHNIGFLVLDALATKEDISWRVHNRFNAKVAETTLGGEKTLLVKPQSFYNETGSVARAIADYYKLDIAQDFLVIHDDLALPFGTIRVRQKGSDAGNNGIKSLNQHLGDNYHRIRVGIWNEHRDRVDDADFVLSPLNKEEATKLQAAVIPHTLELIDSFLQGNLDATSSVVD